MSQTFSIGYMLPYYYEHTHSNFILTQGTREIHVAQSGTENGSLQIQWSLLPTCFMNFRKNLYLLICTIYMYFILIFLKFLSNLSPVGTTRFGAESHR